MKEILFKTRIGITPIKNSRIAIIEELKVLLIKEL